MIANKIFAAFYRLFRCRKVVKGRVTLIEKLNTAGTGSLYEVKRECERRGYDFSYNVITHKDYEVRLSNVFRLLYLFTVKAYKMATSSYIFLNDNFMPLAYMNPDPETMIVQLWHGLGSYKKFGGSSETDPAVLRELKAANERVDYIIAGSENIRANYAEAFMVPESKIVCIGCPQADYYFRSHNLELHRKRLERRYPALAGKKLILYAPTFRGDEERDRHILDHFDFERFAQAVPEDCCLAIRLHPQIQQSKVPDHVVDLTDYPNVRMLLCMTDLLIADYSSIAVEYSLLGRPIVLYAYDMDWYLKKDRGFYFDFEKTAPGPIARNMDELIDCISEQKWDIDKVRAFACLHNSFFDDENASRLADLCFEHRTQEEILRDAGPRDAQAPGKSSDKTPGKASDKTPGKASDKTSGRSSDKTPGRSSDREADDISGKVPGRPSCEASGKASGKVSGDRHDSDKHKKGKEGGEHFRMKIIAGLGNPTDKYKGTRHNVGYMVADRISKETGIAVNRHRFHALCGLGFIEGQRVLLMKPLTYMNRSGESIREAADFYKVDPEDILVIYDDISMEQGMLRIRGKGSAGGHNGMKSIISHLGSDAFPRIRVGIGEKKHPDQDLADYVLGHFSPDEAKAVEEALDKAASAAEMFAGDRLAEAMNLYSVGKKKRGKKKKGSGRNGKEDITDPVPNEDQNAPGADTDASKDGLKEAKKDEDGGVS